MGAKSKSTPVASKLNATRVPMAAEVVSCLHWSRCGNSMDIADS